MSREIVLEQQYGYDVLIGREISGGYEQLLGARDDTRIVAPIYLLLQNWKDLGNVLSGSDEITGIDQRGKFTEKGGGVVITVHGGIDGDTVLTADIIRRANHLYRTNPHHCGADPKGFTRVFGLDLTQSSEGQSVIDGILYDHEMPDGTDIPVYCLEDVQEGRTPRDFRRFAVVRTREQMGRVNSSRKQLYESNEEGNIIWVNPQLLAFANGVDEAVKFAESLDFCSGEGNIVNCYPLNSTGYQMSVPQGFKPHMHWGSISLHSLLQERDCNAVTVSIEELRNRRMFGDKPELEQVVRSYSDKKSEPKTPSRNVMSGIGCSPGFCS
jgi:hypothetical protein